MPTFLKLASVTALMLAVVVACGRKDDGKAIGETSTTSGAVVGAKASCDARAERGTCTEYWKGTSFDLEKSLCSGVRGKFSNGGCTTRGQIGSCATSDGEVKRYYGVTVGDARADCEGDLVKGTFTPAG